MSCSFSRLGPSADNTPAVLDYALVLLDNFVSEGEGVARLHGFAQIYKRTIIVCHQARVTQVPVANAVATATAYQAKR